MRLPNPDRAVVNAAKVRDYLLSFEHPVGQHKAAVFRAAGYRRETWSVLQADLEAVAWLDGARLKATTEYGRLFELPAILRGPAQRSLRVMTIWLVRRREDFPRLITVYPGGRRWGTRNTTQ